MIYIISDENDISTFYIMDWLIWLNKPFTLLDANSFSSITFDLNNSEERIKLLCGYDDITIFDKIYHRRGKVNTIPDIIVKEYKNEYFYKYLNLEGDSLTHSMELHLQERHSYVGSYIKEKENYKIYNLLLAKKAGFLIPETKITSNKQEVQSFFNKYKRIISKPLRYQVGFETKNYNLNSTITKIIKQSDINKLDDTFAPIFLQKYITKSYEIRIFIFEEQLFPMAIFSQNDKKTKIDYRNYSKQKPNRNIPVTLPKETIKSIEEFMKLLQINTGSIDLINTPNNEIYFLEINPQGQFDWVSKNCNYYIEKKIANSLTIINDL